MRQPCHRAGDHRTAHRSNLSTLQFGESQQQGQRAIPRPGQDSNLYRDLASVHSTFLGNFVFVHTSKETRNPRRCCSVSDYPNLQIRRTVAYVLTDIALYWSFSWAMCLRDGDKYRDQCFPFVCQG